MIAASNQQLGRPLHGGDIEMTDRGDEVVRDDAGEGGKSASDEEEQNEGKDVPPPPPPKGPDRRNTSDSLTTKPKGVAKAPERRNTVENPADPRLHPKGQNGLASRSMYPRNQDAVLAAQAAQEGGVGMAPNVGKEVVAPYERGIPEGFASHTGGQHATTSKSRSLLGGSSSDNLDRKIAELQTENNKNAQLAQKWRDESLKRDEIIRSQNHHIRDLEEDRNKVLKKNAELEHNLHEQEQTILEAQSRAFRMLDQAEWAPLEDTRMRSELNNLEKLIRMWSKNYSLQSLSEWKTDGLPKKEQECLLSDWEDIALLSRESPLCPVGFRQRSMEGKMWIFLSAWLTNYVYDKVFVNPFFFMDELMKKILDRDKGHRNRQGKAHLDRDLWYLILEIERAHGETSREPQWWRSETLRLLDPPETKAGSSSRAAELKDMIRAARRHSAETFADMFFDRAKPFIKRAKKIRGDLDEILQFASDLSFRLWTQRSCLTIEERRGLLNKPFSRDSSILTAHGFHNAELHDDESCLDGRPILLLCHPPVIMCGDSEGMDYTRRRVLKKAVVWMGSKS